MKYKVLVANDEKFQLDFMFELLWNNRNFIVYGAEDGKQAYNLVIHS